MKHLKSLFLASLLMLSIEGYAQPFGNRAQRVGLVVSAYVSIMSLVFSLIMTAEAYTPYEPFLIFDKNGVTTKDWQAPWEDIYTEEWVENMYHVYHGSRALVGATPFTKICCREKKQSIAIRPQSIPMKAEEFWKLWRSYKPYPGPNTSHAKKDVTPPQFNRQLAPDELKQVEEKGYYQDENKIIICYPKMSPKTFKFWAPKVYTTFAISSAALYYFAKSEWRKHID